MQLLRGFDAIQAGQYFLWYALPLTVEMIQLAVLAIFVQGWSGLSWDFLTGLPSRKADKAGVFVALMGSLWVCAICGLLALPLGVATAMARGAGRIIPCIAALALGGVLDLTLFPAVDLGVTLGVLTGREQGSLAAGAHVTVNF